MDRIGPTRRPAGPAAGRQRWRTLLFVHWIVPTDVLAPLLPKGLTVDTFDDRAYIGLVPFTMRGVTPLSWLPPIPGTSAFHEVNVRTYVHRDGEDPGVWFFSLDAANRLAVWAARRFFHLPYYFAEMSLETTDSRIAYRSRRRDASGAHLDLRYAVGQRLGPSAPDSLEHFLAERYVLYSEHEGTLFRGQVHHAPYDLHAAHVEHLDESLIAAAQIARGIRPVSALFSPGVDVEVFPLVKLPVLQSIPA